MWSGRFSSIRHSTQEAAHTLISWYQRLCGMLAQRWKEISVTLLVLASQFSAFVWAGTTRVVANPDVQLHYWTLWWWAHALRVSPLGVWDAPQFVPYPYTLAYSDHLAALGIVTAPLVWLHLPVAAILNATMLACALATAWAMYAVVRAEGAAVWPAVLVAVAVTCGAFRSTHLVHLQLQMTWMLPVAILWFRSAVRAPQLWSWASVGLILLMAVAFSLSSYHTLMLIPVLGVTAVATFFMTPAPMRMSTTVRMAILAVCCGIALLPTVWPYITAQQMTGVTRTLTEQANWSAPIQAWFAVLPTHPLWPRLFGSLVSARPEFVLAPGCLLSVGALIAVRDMRRAQLIWVVVVVLGFIFASGTALRLADGDSGISLPVANLLVRIPGYSALRVPARWGWLVTFGLAMLAAAGWSRLVRMHPRWIMLAVCCLVLDLGWPQVSFKLAPQPDTVPNVVNWMATQPAGATVLELPFKAQPQSDVQSDRLWWQTIHRQRSVTGYSGIIPATQVLLARDAAHLPRADILARMQAFGVNWIVIYRGTADGDKLATAMQTCTTCRVRYDDADAVVYAIPSSPLYATPFPAQGHIWISGDARLHDLVALGAVHEFGARGLLVSGPARPRFYPALAVRHELPDGWLLSRNEEPESVGVTVADGVMTAADAILYRRPLGLIAAQALTPPHATLQVAYNDTGDVLVDNQRIATATTSRITVVLDAAVLAAQRIGSTTYSPGAQLVTLTVSRGQQTQLTWDAQTANLLRVRVFDQMVTLPALQSQPLNVAAQVEADGLRIPDWHGEILVRGIEDVSGRAVTHVVPPHTQRIAPGVIPVLQNGHYQVVIVTPHGQQIVLANLLVDAQSWHWHAVPAQIMLVY